MELPFDFKFSQNNLQDFQDCERRFELKHILHQAWPAEECESVMELERHKLLGVRFHALIQKKYLGLPLINLETSIDDPILLSWWKNYLQLAPKFEKAEIKIEYELSIPFAEYRLIAKFDLMAIETNNQITILDWKTNHFRLPDSYLKNRLQSIVYPLVLFYAFNKFNSKKEIAPEKIDMIYWFPAFPDEPVIIHYSAELHKHNHEYLTRLIGEIKNRQSGNFALTNDQKKCRYCVYRSLCKRGVQAGEWTEYQDAEIESSLLNFDFDQIAEIPF